MPDKPIIVTAPPRRLKAAAEHSPLPVIVTARKPGARRRPVLVPNDPQADAEVAAFFARMIRPA